MHDVRFHRHNDALGAEGAGAYGNRVIAVCGKGGVGKTAFSAMLVNELAKREQTGSLLAVDADPALGLALALGVQCNVPTIGQVREQLIGAAKSGVEEQERLIAENLDMLVFDSVVDFEGYSFLAMGRSEALGCYCSVNDILRDAMGMLANRFDTIVIDGEAGLEQINRQVASCVGTLLLVSDGSARAMNTVVLLSDIAMRENMVSSDGIELVFNRSTLCEDELFQQAQSAGLPVLGCIPCDGEVARLDASNTPLGKLSSSSSAMHEVAHIVDHLLGVAHEH